MRERRQEKVGWVGGLLGGFVWVLVLSVILLVGDRILPAVIGLLISAAASAAILFFAPWRHPRTPYRRLLVPIYVVFFGAVVWGVWSFGGPRRMGFNSWWALLLLMPLMMPLWSVGNRRWEDPGVQQSDGAGGAAGGR